MSGQNAINDAFRITYAMTDLLGIPMDINNTDDYVNHPLVKGLVDNGYVGFMDDIVGASEEDLMSLTYAPDINRPTDLIPVPQSFKRKMVQLRAFFHFGSENSGRPIEITRITKAEFDEFRTKWHDPNKPVIPFGTALPDDVSEGVKNWLKSAKPHAAFLQTLQGRLQVG